MPPTRGISCLSLVLYGIRIVEVGEEEDIRLLVQSGSVDWSENAEDEDPAILWALRNEKLGIVDILMTVNKINLQGYPSADLTIKCDSETFIFSSSGLVGCLIGEAMVTAGPDIYRLKFRL